MNICLAGARAEASRRNGAKSRGPKTIEGKARSSQNALKHGLRAHKFVVVGGERAQEFEALEAALMDELAPAGVLQGLLASRIARAAWRLERAERIEAELFERHADRERNLGLALIRAGHGSRAFDTLLRYRGSALAELWRALRLMKALQAEQHVPEMREIAGGAILPEVDTPVVHEEPIEPETRANPDEIAARPAPDEPSIPPEPPAGDAASRKPRIGLKPAGRAPAERPIEPEGRRRPRGIALRTACEAPLQAAENLTSGSPLHLPRPRAGVDSRADGRAGIGRSAACVARAGDASLWPRNTRENGSGHAQRCRDSEVS